MNSDTPRTDEEVSKMRMDCDDSCCAIYVYRDGKETDEPIVLATFARQLERETAKLREALRQIEDHHAFTDEWRGIAREALRTP